MQDLDNLKKEYNSPRLTRIENAEEAVYEEKNRKKWKLCS